MLQPVSRRIPLIQKHLFPAGLLRPIKGKRERPSPRSEQGSGEGSEDCQGESGKGRHQHPATTHQGGSARRVVDRARSPGGFCWRIRVCFLCLKQAGSFPGFPMKHSKLSFSRITPPPGRGAILTVGRGEWLCSAFYCNAHTNHVQPKTNALSRGIRSSVTVMILANTSRGSTFPHPGVVLSVPA